MPAPAVIPALIVYSKVVVVKTLVFYFLAYGWLWLAYFHLVIGFYYPPLYRVTPRQEGIGGGSLAFN